MILNQLTFSSRVAMMLLNWIGRFRTLFRSVKLCICTFHPKSLIVLLICYFKVKQMNIHSKNVSLLKKLPRFIIKRSMLNLPLLQSDFLLSQEPLESKFSEGESQSFACLPYLQQSIWWDYRHFEPFVVVDLHQIVPS